MKRLMLLVGFKCTCIDETRTDGIIYSYTATRRHSRLRDLESWTDTATAKGAHDTWTGVHGAPHEGMWTTESTGMP